MSTYKIIWVGWLTWNVLLVFGYLYISCPNYDLYKRLSMENPKPLEAQIYTMETIHTQKPKTPQVGPWVTLTRRPRTPPMIQERLVRIGVFSMSHFENMAITTPHMS